MPRVRPAELDETAGYTRRVLEAQARIWGAPLTNHLIYARKPALFEAVRGMWNALAKESRLDKALVALINRRVASLNGCVF